MGIARFHLAVLALVAFAGCTASPPGPPICVAGVPCTTEGTEGGATCVLGRCRPKTKDPLFAKVESRRLLLFPEAVAVVSENGVEGGGQRLPESVALGQRALGSTSLLLRFDVPIVEGGEVMGAFLVLETASSTAPPDRPVHVEIARILEPWSADIVSWGRHPRLDVAEKSGTVGAALSSPLRIDVTHLVKAWAHRRGHDHGIALLAEPDDPFGATFSLGVVEKRGPRLEVYVR